MTRGRRGRMSEEEYEALLEGEAHEREMNQPKLTREEIFAEVLEIEQSIGGNSTTYTTDPSLYQAVQSILTLLKRNL